MPDVTVIVLTLNEAKHIERCIRSLQPFARQIIVVDSFSTDDTVLRAQRLGARILTHTFVNYAKQFNWALDTAGLTTPWVMRMDADEYVSPELGLEIATRLDSLSADVTGIYVKRRVIFMDTWVRHGGYYPIELLRIWRTGRGRLEDRWMDEHVRLANGSASRFDNDIVDHNLNDLTWWTEKHNRYATREAIDVLGHKYRLSRDEGLTTQATSQARTKRWLKEGVYYRMPHGIRALIYFLYRYIVLLGFLDGRAGLLFHVLQGFWYRFLVDAKVMEIEHRAFTKGKDIRAVLHEDYGVTYE